VAFKIKNIDMIILFACLVGWLNSSPVKKLRHDLLKTAWAAVNFINIFSAFFVRMSFRQLFYVRSYKKKLPKRHPYEKIAQKMLMKLTPGVNTSIMHVRFPMGNRVQLQGPQSLAHCV